MRGQYKRKNRFEIHETVNGEPYFVLRAKNNEIVVLSEAYSSLAACKSSIWWVKFKSIFASIEDKRKDMENANIRSQITLEDLDRINSIVNNEDIDK